MNLSLYRNLPFPQNLWSAVFEKIVSFEDIPADWELTLEHVLSTLRNAKERSDRGRESMLYYFKDGYSFRQIGEIYGVSGSNIRQVIAKAIWKLRHSWRSNILLYGLERSEYMRDNCLGPWQNAKPPQKDLSEDLDNLDQHSLHDLGVSHGVIFALRDAQINTVGDLIQYSDADLLTIPQFGPARLNSIKKSLAKYNLSLREGVQIEKKKRPYQRRIHVEEIFPEPLTPAEEVPPKEQRFVNWREIQLRDEVSSALASFRFDTYSSADIQAFVDSIINNPLTNHYDETDPFWRAAESVLLRACCFYLLSECKPEECNLSSVMRLLYCHSVEEGCEDEDSTLDMLIYGLQEKDPSSPAVLSYSIYKCAGGGRTAQSILISCQTQLLSFANRN